MSYQNNQNTLPNKHFEKALKLLAAAGVLYVKATHKKSPTEKKL